MTVPCAIRAMMGADLPALKAVIDANDLFPSDMLDEMAAAYFTDTPGADMWLAATTGVGPVALLYAAPERMTDGTWNCLLIAVHPDLHGRGIGAALMAHLEAYLAAQGARVLLVETSGLPAFARTRGFYTHIGYTEEARIRDFYKAGEDKIVFHRTLRA